MSASDEARIDALSQQAAAARNRLKRDVEALAYKVSPENLKQEAVELTEQVARDVRGAVVRWGVQAEAFVRHHPVAVTAAAGFGGLLMAAIQRRDRRLLFGALACGATALALGLQTQRARTRRQLLLTHAPVRTRELY